MEKYGRYEHDKIAVEMRTKTGDEVKEYSKVFWDNVEELEFGSKYIERIEKGE